MIRRGVSACALSLAVVHSCFVAHFSARNSHFQGDDIVGLYFARQLPFRQYLATPIDVHFVPLHRLVTYAVGRLAPANFTVAVTFLLACHLLAVFFLYWALEHLRPSWVNAVFASWYATHVYIGVLFTWWTSGLHRLPYILGLSIALYGYAQYRWRPRARSFACVIGGYVASLGFFEKGVLVPLVLAGVEVCLWQEASRRTRRALVPLYIVLGAITLFYLHLWRHAVRPEWTTIGGGPSFLLTYLKFSWQVLLQSVCGRVYDGAGWGLTVVALLVAATVLRNRGAASVWIAGAVVVSLSLVSTALSTPRARAWGIALSAAHRYYPDVMILFVLFAALACQRAMVVRRARARVPRSIFDRPLNRLCAWPAVAASAAVATLSLREVTGELASLYKNQSAVRAFMGNVVSGLEPLRKRRTPPQFIQGKVPGYVSPLGGWLADHSLYVEALGVHARFVKKGRYAYRILPTGKIVLGG